MDGKKKSGQRQMYRLPALTVPAGAEETMTHDLDEVIVEADRNTLPGDL